MKRTLPLRRAGIIYLLFAALVLPATAKSKRDAVQTRENYLSNLQAQGNSPTEQRTAGSLWSSNAALSDSAADYKAIRLHDTVIVRVAEQTTAQSSGNVTSQRSFDTNSSISGLAAHVSTGGVNPIVTAQSATNLKGQGATAAASQLRTSLSGQVIAVLPNGNLVIEAERTIAMNHQRETIIIRGVTRPGDVGADNSVLSTSLANLEIELKGKGVISDATRPINPLVRRLLWLIGF